MKAKFIGDPRDPGGQKNLPDEVTVFGVTFPRDKFVDVPDDVASKFVGNTHFETRGKDPEPDVAPAPVATSVTTATTPAQTNQVNRARP